MTTQNVPPKFNYLDSEDKFSAYTNHTGISLTNFDVRILFGQIEQKMDHGQTTTGQGQAVTVISQGSVVMSPQHAKLFCENLRRNIEQFEKLFGTITMPPTTQIPAPAKG